MPLNMMRDEKTGRHRWDKWFGVWAGIFLSIAFMKETWSNHLEWLDYIGYAAGMAGSAAPYLIVKFIQAWRGQGDAPAAIPGVAESAPVPVPDGGN